MTIAEQLPSLMAIGNIKWGAAAPLAISELIELNVLNATCYLSIIPNN
jgi:hypothetical protein